MTENLSVADQFRALLAELRPSELAALESEWEREVAVSHDAHEDTDLFAARAERYADRLIALAREADPARYDAIIKESVRGTADQLRAAQAESERKREEMDRERIRRIQIAAGPDYEWLLALPGIALLVWGIGSAFVDGTTSNGRLAISALLALAGIYLLVASQRHARERAARIIATQALDRDESTNAD